VGGYSEGRFMLLIEKLQAGIWSGPIEEYLNWLFWEARHDAAFTLPPSLQHGK